ncbi:MAG TPA: methylenetetrahydrofolate reductase [Kiritimatiellia bacterium]|jgi:methylenetetrahydrofolate reductase (NADPH)|nr:methylenetetrahydrofolate reductase [Kiritimatiellia bacterium]HOM58263.1 methylenetetrahydrofolate reductase [Kiritimatiellia bacterium]HOR97458.1 methylenetetrahydrofolate reductase [Kiritimatiellia bacterium]HPC49935.1 methylenetetrahydrofolate reductase [Kiritimatiellia bacterium]HPK37122.1 methylenetetrahydrofolate reductase [Kiritimatiellia bacterium]
MFFFDKIRRGEPTISFEFFPPKTPDGWARLYATIAETARLNVDFVSVTYGAGGSTRESTVELVASLQNNLAIHAMAHLTCLGHSQAELARILDRLAEKRVPAIMALRGDPPQGETAFRPHPYGFAHADDLIGFIRDGWPDFKIGCAAYPEGHPESFAPGEARTPDIDIGILRRKQENGADFAVTQLFFDNAVYFHFVDQARAAGVTIPLLPGIMPMSSAKQIERFIALAGCSIPETLKQAARAPDVAEAGFLFALDQCRDLLTRGAPGIHLYSLNQAELSSRLLTALRDERLLR